MRTSVSELSETEVSHIATRFVLTSRYCTSLTTSCGFIASTERNRVGQARVNIEKLGWLQKEFLQFAAVIPEFVRTATEYDVA